jgi:hypothetical protein
MQRIPVRNALRVHTMSEQVQPRYTRGDYSQLLPKDSESSVPVPGMLLHVFGMPDRPRPPATTALIERRTIVILCGGWLKTVAVDLESRFTEASRVLLSK